MSEVEKKLRELQQETVSMRELNQKTRSVIDRVCGEGISLTVTDRGRPVAELRPVEHKTGLDLLEEMGVLSQRGKRFEVTWEPIERSGMSFADFHDEEQDETWMDELMGRA